MESRRHLEKAISELREFKGPDIWPDIEAILSTSDDNTDFNLEGAIGDLKVSEAPDVWLSIEASLPQRRGKQNFLF